MKPEIAIIDYGVGNLRSVYRGLEAGGAKPIVTDDMKVVKRSDGIVLPGVGAFGDAMKRLEGFRDVIIESAGQKPIFGICLGMQLYFTRSEEDGVHVGLDIMKGNVVSLPKSVKIPQMGWNSIEIKKESIFMQGINSGDYFYFVHSFYAKPEEDITVATSDYGIEFPAIVEKDLLFATQFHPEKSGKVGLKMLENFVKISNDNSK
ncbi:imidazole glycerol phosphate synthase subunit HisH [archaeon]|nr:imidazole glycerol phosphate synthase subunit HisH [archaeon]